MKKENKLDWGQVHDLLRPFLHSKPPGPQRLFGVPRGGAIVAGLAAAHWPKDFIAVSDPNDADAIVDDIIDSGRTYKKWKALYPQLPFLALVDKVNNPFHRKLGWVTFPWERTNPLVDAEDNIVRLLQHLGEDPKREGLLDTPKRVIKAWKEQTAGYGQDPKTILASADFDAGRYDEMIMSRDIDFFSNCEHHMLPFFGSAHVAYLPNRKNPRVVGLSKLARLVQCFAQRLQIQEQLTAQIADAIEDHLQAAGVGVIIEAKHHCQCARGIRSQNSTMVTSALRGRFKSGPARAEFMALIGLNK